MSLRSKHFRHERVARLHRATLEHISREGVRGLRLTTLARELGYTTAALYRYYPSKEALIAGVQKHTLTLMHQALSRMIEEAQLESALAKVLLCAHFYSRYAQGSPASFALNSGIFSHPHQVLHGEQRQEILSVMQRLLEMIQAQLNLAGLSRTDPHDLSRALCFWSALYGVILTHKYREDFLIPSPDELAQTLCIGWGADSGHVARAQALISAWSADRDLSSFTHLDLLEWS